MTQVLLKNIFDHVFAFIANSALIQVLCTKI